MIKSCLPHSQQVLPMCGLDFCLVVHTLMQWSQTKITNEPYIYTSNVNGQNILVELIFPVHKMYNLYRYNNLWVTHTAHRLSTLHLYLTPMVTNHKMRFFLYKYNIYIFIYLYITIIYKIV